MTESLTKQFMFPRTRSVFSQILAFRIEMISGLKTTLETGELEPRLKSKLNFMLDKLESTFQEEAPELARLAAFDPRPTNEKFVQLII